MVSLLAILVLPVGVKAATYFDDFEGSSGGTFLSGWAVVTGSANSVGWFANSTVQSFSSSHSFGVSAASPANNAAQRTQYVSVASSTQGSLEGELYVDSTISTNLTQAFVFGMSQLAGTSQRSVGLRYRINAGAGAYGLTWDCSTLDGCPSSMSNLVIVSSSTPIIPPNTWTKINLYWRDNSGARQYRIIVQGVWDTGWKTASSSPAFISTMIQHQSPNSGALDTDKIFFDDVKVQTDGDMPFIADPTNTNTRIDTVDPANLQTVATSSIPYNFQSNIYVKDTDYESGMRFMLKLDRNTDQQGIGSLLAFDSAFGNKTYIPITASGASLLATSSDSLNIDFPLRIGDYSARWEIQTPRFHLFGLDLFYTTLAASSTTFTVATSTAIDRIVNDQTGYIQGILDSTSDPLASCHFSLFDTALDLSLGSAALNCLGGILHWMFILPPTVLSSTVNQLKDGFLTRVPVGYFTRVVSAISGGTAGTLPTVSADIPIPNSDGELTIAFNIDDIVQQAGDMQDSFVDPAGHTAKQIIEPIIQLIVGLLVLMFIYNDLFASFRRL